METNHQENKFALKTPVSRYIAGGVVALLVLGLGVFAIQRSEPGDAFYGIERSVIESVQGIFFFGGSKVTFHTARLEERLRELREVQADGAAEGEVLMTVVGAVEKNSDAAFSVLVKNDSPTPETIEDSLRVAALVAAHQREVASAGGDGSVFEAVVDNATDQFDDVVDKYAEVNPEAIDDLVASEIQKIQTIVQQTENPALVENTTGYLQDAAEDLDHAKYKNALEEIYNARFEILVAQYLAS